uniref:ABC transporter domain-containing protein n=1 Tax=Knipowitschia caucasica TaxID=637954 RepID=A0AAV2K1R7_KNICA
MAFLRQLQLLLWKNGLGTIRRPVWSITLILWPIIIFIIIAVTRHQFPPVLRQTCYVGPRNLPSTGFFPFLETLLCNSDSNCQNTSQSAHPHRNKRSTEESPDFPLSKIIGELRQFANLENTDHDPAVLLNVLSGNFGASSPGLSLGALNETLFGDHPIANSNKSAGRLKSAFCTIAFLFINNTSTTDAGPVIAFCTSNNTVFEVTINTLYKAVRELVMTQQIRPEDLGKLAENILELFDQLQKEPSLWEFLHVLPQIVNPTSPDQLLGNLKKLFESLQLFLNIIEHKFPEVKANMSSVHPFIEAGVSLTDYMRNWPGKNVKIRLGDVMTSNDSLCQMMGNMEISLDQALALYFDTKMVSDYVCQITYNPVLMAACATGTVEKCLSSTSTNKLLQQTLLKWSTLVAPHDLSLAKGLLHSLMELFGGSRMSRATRSLEEQAQNVEEELFLGVGKVVREILQISPEATAVVNQILQAGFQSMTFATKAMAVLEGGMDSLLKDVTRIKMIVQVLSTDQPQSTSWMIQAFNSVSEMIAKIFAGESLTCDNVLSEFEWLFSIKTIRRELWQSFFCENTTTIEQTLLSDWTPLIENALALYHTLSGHSSYNVTLPMILSEWHGLWNRSERVVQLSQEWGGANWTSWVPANSSSHLLLASLQNSVAVFLGKLGQKIVHEWPEAKSYMYMTDWILHYEPGVTASPNCSMDVATFAIECHGNLNWEKFVNALLRAVMSPNEDLLISCLKGSVQLLQHVYSNFFKYEAASFLHREVEGGHMIASVKTASGPDGLNELILNIMFEVQSLLPPNDTAQFYVGTIINITKSILQPSPGNSSLLPMDSTEEIMSYIMTKLLEVWNMLCPVVVGESCSPPSSTQGFADLPMVLEELINGQTNNVTWMKLHNVVDTAMTFIVVPELSNNISCLVEMFEKSASEEVREMEALTDLILSLQTPFMKILTEITRSLNGSHFNMSEVSERLEQAVEQTIIMALEKSNGTHNCQEVLKIWDPVREAAGLRPSVMTMWCNISLLSVIEAFGDQSALTNGTCTEMGAMSSRTVAARIVMSIRSLYDSDVAQSEAMEQFTEEFESLLSALVSHPLSQTAKYNLNIQLQALATHNSLQFIELFSDEVDEMFPFLKPYMKGMRKMLKHILTNSSSVEESPAEFFKEADLLSLSDPFEMRDHALSNHNASRIRRRREVSFVPVSSPMDDFMTLFTMDYRSLWTGLQVPPTASEIQETFLMFFDNSDLSFILKEATKEYDSDLDGISSSEIVDSMLNLAKIFLENDFASLSLWVRAISALPDGHSSISVMKDVAHAIDAESPEIQRLMQETLETVSALFLSDPTELQALQLLQRLEEQVCDLERTNAIGLLEQSFSVEPGVLCQSIVPGVKILVEGLLFNMTSLVHNMAEVFVGDPSLYNLQINWTSMISEILGFNISALGALNMTNSAPVVTVGEMVRNRTAFMRDLQTFGFAPEVADQLSNSTLPDNLQILWWLVNLAGCNSSAQSAVTESEKSMFETFCRLGPEQLYNFTLLMVQHLNTEQFLYRMVLPEEVQRVMGTMTQVALYVMDMVRKLGPNLETWFSSLETFSLSANNEFRQMSRSQRKTISSKATFVTISRALCRNGIVALFAATKNPHFSVSPPPFENIHQRQEMIERFKIPHDATPFCTNMYLDMVNTTGGAIAWAFLKPMLMGKILFTPDTPQTRAVITKANSTLQQFADLKHYSQDWIKSSEYISKSTTILTQTLPLLQNSLSNAFVKNFIEMQTGVSVDSMQETLNNFSNVTVMLEKNKDLVGQINALSTLMVDISSCITFDRYQGYDSEEELNREAQDLAKDRALYASVIFKLPKGSDSRKRRSVSSSTPLPPRMHYTIRMHMDNVMRTDRVRNPFFSKETHISARQTLRYNRGFIYLQESIDRAIIEIQANKTVTDTAVQIQPFPYPCHKRDEFLEAISFVFPLLLMIAWVLFVADFVKKLVHEREMKLHEYMKMMGVNPLSHFFAWFLESAFHLVITIFFLTLVLKYGDILPKSDGFLLFLYLCDYGLSILAFSFLVSTFFDQTYIASLSGSLLYVLSFFPFIVVMAMETHFSFSVKSLLGLFSPTAFSYASQYVSRYEAQGEGIQWSNSYSSPIAGDTASFGWLCWLMLIDTFLYLIIAAYIRTVFPGQSGIPSPWYFPFTASFWKSLCGCKKSKGAGRGLFLTNIMQTQLPAFPDSDENGKDKGDLSSKRGENFSDLPVGVALHGLTKIYGRQAAIENLNVAFYEGHVTSLLGHNGAGKTTTMSILTGLFPPSSGSVEVYGRDMQANLAEVRTELGVCMQYDVLFDHMTAKEHLLLYGQIKAPHWTKGELKEQVRTILEETDMYAHRHKRVGTLSGGMKRKLSISIAFIGGSRLVVLDEPTTGVDPCSRRSIWDVVIKHKKGRTIIMSTHHLDEAEVLSDRIAFLERGGLKCCGSPFYLKEQLGQGYKLTLTKKMQAGESEQIDNAELKAFVQAHVPAARLKEAQGSDLVYLLPPFSSNNASSYRSLLTALDSNLDALQLGGYGISDTTLEEVFLHLTHDSLDSDALCTVSETVSDTESINSYPDSEESSYGDTAGFTGTPTVSGVKLAWQQFTAILIKRFHHSRRDWKGLIAQLLLPVLFVAFAMGLGSIRSDLKHYPSLELSPALYSIGPSYSFFSDRKSKLADALMSFPGLDNTCLENSNDHICPRSTGAWSGENGTKPFSTCKCVQEKEVCGSSGYVPPHKQLSSSQIVYNLTDLDVENYIVATSNDFIRNRYGGFDFGLPLPSNLRMDVNTVPENRTLSKVWFNPEGHHTMPAYLNSINNLLLRSNLPEDKDPSQYSISVSSHPYFGRPDDEDSIVQGMLQIMVALCILAGYSITTASFAIYEVSELHSGSKRLQHIAGVSEPFYWAVNFFYDMVVYMIPVVLTVGVIAAFQVPAFNERQNLGAVTLLLVLFGFSTFPWMYLLSSVFKTAEMAFISYVCINLFLSVNTIIPTSILFFMRQITQQNAEGMKLLFDRLSNAFLIFPQFNFGNGLLELARMNIEVQLLSGYGIDAYKNPFSTEALGWMMIASFIQGLFFFALRLLWNKTIVRKVRSLIVKGRTVPLPWVDEDEDVAAEHLRVSSGAASADVLQVNQLTKVYQHLNKKVPAVKKLSLGVPAGECFGLLGVNGAGKTTTFKMLTGDVSPTEGTAQIRDRDGRLVDIMECRNQGVNIGYCPQVDALDGLMSGEEHLYFYARLHGISKRDTPGVVNYLLRRLELDRYRDTVCDSYSCGTRRKLSTALALVGHPQILLLDEPSSGMDPRTKRHLWKIITAEVKGKCAVVLTSHSMEECEALCGRLAVMVQGQFRCLGSLQHIKNRFGSGFTVRMYLAKASCDAEAITRFMQSRFPSTYLKDQHSAMVEYHVPVAPGGVADIFGQLESSKEHLEIQHFSVSQTTLDEVFINFAMGKIGMETVHMEEDDEFGDDYSLKGVDA